MFLLVFIDFFDNSAAGLRRTQGTLLRVRSHSFLYHSPPDAMAIHAHASD
jgi:hypothetical protein